MINLREKDNKRRVIVLLISVVIIAVGFIGVANIIENRLITYHYEKWISGSENRNTRFTISGIEDANITISFIDQPNLWYLVDITHYTSIKKHSVEGVTKPSFLPLRVHLRSITPVRNINIVLGTDMVHSLYISGENLNTRVIVDNGAKISGSKCKFYGTGIFQFVLKENVNFTSVGMDVEIGDFYAEIPAPELVLIDINLPVGMNGHFTSGNASFIRNDWPVNYGNEWGTASINEPLLDIKILHSTRVRASLRI